MTKRVSLLVLVAAIVGVWGLANLTVSVADEAAITDAQPAAAPVVTQNVDPTVTTVAPVQVPKTVSMKVVESAEGDKDSFLLSASTGIIELNPKVDVVLLCDTSAASGSFQTEMLADVQLLIGALSDLDRVRIFATDAKTIPMNDNLMAPRAEGVTQALDKLSKRVPLGSGDMKQALETAALAFDPDTQAAKVIVYIGQGASRANMFTPEELSKMGDDLAAKHISVDAVAMGPSPDVVLLKTLAAKTGGKVISAVGGDAELADVAQLPELVRTKVFWPKPEAEQAGTDATVTLFPSPCVPFRGDNRESIMLGKLAKNTNAAKIVINLQNGEPLEFNVTPTKETNPYIADMVKYVETQKAWLPLNSDSDVTNVMENVNQHVDSLLGLAENYLKQDDMHLTEARKLVDQAKTKDPMNPKVVEMDKLVTGLEESMQNKTSVFGTPARTAGTELTARVGHDNALIQAARVRVQNTINNARQIMVREPDEASLVLEQELDTVASEDLIPEIKDTLNKQLRAAIREAKARKEVLAYQEQEDRTRLTEQRDRQIVLDNARAEQQRLKQMMDRFDSLMQEGKYQQAEENVANEVLLNHPHLNTAVTAVLTARQKGTIENILNVRARRNKGFVDTLYQVERANIPIPDEPPVLYPDSEVWKRLTERRVERYRSMDLAQQSSREKELMEKLKEETSINANETELRTVIEDLKKNHDIEIQLDTLALEDMGISEDEPITMNVHGISLGAALRLMLKSYDLMYVIQDEVLKITSIDVANENLVTRVYPVADLVLPIENLSPFQGDFFGIGSGSSRSSGSSNSTWTQGSNFMNMMNPVIRNQVDNAVKESGVFYNVPEKVEKADKADSKAAKANAKAETKWNKYFKKLDKATPEELAASQAYVRETVRKMREKKDFAGIIALIEAALRNQQAQTWMYETLAISMVMDKRPADDVERAMTSAIEFCENPNQLLLIAYYIENLGFPERALALYKELGNMFPDSPEPYVYAMKLARRPDVDNVEMLKWATLGMLRLDVAEDREADWNDALLNAKAIVDRLEKEGKADDAKQFASDMDLAQQRDCKIVVSWTGDADIDLFVEEPNGSICSKMNRRSAGGGFLVKDGFTSQKDKNGANKASETYICSQGFPGTYKLLAKLMWGEVTGNKAIVDITIHYRSGEQKQIKRALEIKNNGIGVEFVLDEGRRKGNAQEQQFVADAREAMTVQQISKVLSDNIDHKAMASYSGTDLLTDSYYPYMVRGAVGYKPEVIWLPTGTQMQTTGVISADRRYVRISAAPLFSTIPEVNTFNYTDGETKREERD